MKRADLLRALRASARERDLDLVVTEGGKHTKVAIGDAQTTIPRHREINELTAVSILRQMGAIE